MTQTKRCPIFKFGSWWCLPSPITAGERLRDQRFLRAGVRLRYQRLQTLRRPFYRLLRHRSVLGPEFRRDHRASGPSWPLMAEIGHYLEGIIPPTVHLVLLAVFMEVSPSLFQPEFWQFLLFQISARFRSLRDGVQPSPVLGDLLDARQLYEQSLDCLTCVSSTQPSESSSTSSCQQWFGTALLPLLHLGPIVVPGVHRWTGDLLFAGSRPGVPLSSSLRGMVTIDCTSVGRFPCVSSSSCSGRENQAVAQDEIGRGTECCETTLFSHNIEGVQSVESAAGHRWSVLVGTE